MPDPTTLKLVHVGSASLSITGFLLRGILRFNASPLMQRRWMRVWPHFIDSALLISGVWMAFLLQLHPGNSPWLGAKLVALILYILLGFVALRLGRTRKIRLVAFGAALLTFAYIVATALTRSPLPD